MYEPHLVNHGGEQPALNGDSTSILDELDKIAPIKSFDAFPNVNPAAKFLRTLLTCNRFNLHLLHNHGEVGY